MKRMRITNRRLTRGAFAGAAMGLALLTGCAIPGDDDTATPVVAAEAAPADAAVPVTTTRGFKVAAGDSHGVLSLTGTAATLVPTGAEGRYVLEITGVADYVSRIGVGVSGSMPLQVLLDDPASLALRPGVANAVLVLRDPAVSGQDAHVQVVLTVSAPRYLAGTDTLVFDASTLGADEIDRELARHAGVGVFADGRIEAGLGVVDAAEVTSGGFAQPVLYLDASGTQVIGECAIVPNTQCPGADLFRSDLVGADFTNANLAGANFAMSTLRAATFDGANLAQAELFRSDLSGTSWVGADLRGAAMYQLSLIGSDLSGARAAGALMFRSELDNATFVNADFTQAALQQATIVDSDGRGATFSGANLFRVEMSGSNFSGARMNDANLAQTIAHSARFQNADLSHVDFTHADLRYADLSGADLSYTNLAGANLTGANLAGADLTGAVLWLTDLTDANLHGVTFNRTTCPNGRLSTARGCVIVQSPKADPQVGPRSDLGLVGPRAGALTTLSDRDSYVRARNVHVR